MSSLRRLVRKPILLLLAALLVAGLLQFRDYGLTWDEPLFYGYADALGYAYTPANWVSGHFDLNLSYGPSATDHKTRGPAYLLVAREPVYFLELFGLDTASAWHFVNFLTFLVGVYFVYRLCALFVRDLTAVAAAAFFALQPMLWGHAFINPKDMPFLVFLTGAVWLGFRMADRLIRDGSRSRLVQAAKVLLPAVFLGVATSNRVLGPLAGLLVVLYFLAGRPGRRLLPWIVLYAVVAALVMLVTWPYLWESPLRFVQVFQFMSENPTVLSVLFAGTVYRAYDLPRRYLPFFMGTTLTELVWPLFLVGILSAGWMRRNVPRRLIAAGLMLAWFAVPLLYAVAARPPLYDGMRHFLFILPPVFAFVAIALDFLFLKIGNRLANTALAAVLLAPGVFGIIQLHPYEYTYFNTFVGGTGGAFRHYETDYWLTCYREAVLHLDATVAGPVSLYVHREPEVAQPYAAANVSVHDQRGAAGQIQSGDYVLVNTRTNEDRDTFRDAPAILSVGRAGATFCVIKRIP
jgi:4-amino-4-deoxy-L-arabinose transferase-like glycosyltransferase